MMGEKFLEIIFVCGVISMMGFMVYAAYHECHNRRKPVFLDDRPLNIGEIVYVRISGEKAQVVNFSHGKVCCRVCSGRIRVSGVLSEDSYTREYVIVQFEPYELVRELEKE